IGLERHFPREGVGGSPGDADDMSTEAAVDVVVHAVSRHIDVVDPLRDVVSPLIVAADLRLQTRHHTDSDERADVETRPAEAVVLRIPIQEHLPALSRVTPKT